MSRRRAFIRVKHIAIIVFAVVTIGVILWLDIATGIWSNLVIISGLAAGFVTFLLTALVVDRVMQRNTERKWAPVSRLALTDFLHALADDELSEISRGEVVARQFEPLDAGVDHAAASDALHELRLRIVDEREKLAGTLSRWVEFLASNGSNEGVLRHSADIALKLDAMRDATLEAETASEISAGIAAVNTEIAECNAAVLRLEAELRSRIAEENRLARAR